MAYFPGLIRLKYPFFLGMKSNTSYLVRLFGYVSSSIPYFLISFFGFVLFAAAQVGAAEWLRRIVDFIEKEITNNE